MYCYTNCCWVANCHRLSVIYMICIYLIKCSREGGGRSLGSDERLERGEGLQAAPRLAVGGVLLGDQLREGEGRQLTHMRGGAWE